MKKLTLTFVFLFGLLTSVSFAQKFAFVNTEYILENIPEYKEAQKKLDEMSANWQRQIEAKYSEIDKLFKSYQAEQLLLTDEMKKKREDEIIRKEKEAKDFQREKFGVEGELFVKRKELVQPIQDMVYNAIKDVAEAGSFAIIFDAAGQANILYSSPKSDKSDDVLKKLGYNPKR
jgi:outer membrane protein